MIAGLNEYQMPRSIEAQQPARLVRRKPVKPRLACSMRLGWVVINPDLLLSAHRVSAEWFAAQLNRHNPGFWFPS